MGGIDQESVPKYKTDVSLFHCDNFVGVHEGFVDEIAIRNVVTTWLAKNETTVYQCSYIRITHNKNLEYTQSYCSLHHHTSISETSSKTRVGNCNGK